MIKGVILVAVVASVLLIAGCRVNPAPGDATMEMNHSQMSSKSSFEKVKHNAKAERAISRRKGKTKKSMLK